jgi:hypothetical protein
MKMEECKMADEINETTTQEVAAEPVAKETATIAAIGEVTTQVVQTLTADQLLALSKAEWEDFSTTVKAAIAAKEAEEKAILKAKVAEYMANYKTYVLPVVKYGAGIAVVLKVFNII